MPIDIAKLADETKEDDIGVEVPIEGRDGEPALDSKGNPVTFTVLGYHSKRVRAVSDAQQRRQLRTRTRRVLEPKEVLANRIELATAAVLRWTGVEDNGTPVECTPELCRTVFTAAPFILEQVERVMLEYGAFFKNASTS